MRIGNNQHDAGIYRDFEPLYVAFEIKSTVVAQEHDAARRQPSLWEEIP
jgi:hypothetical protein